MNPGGTGRWAPRRPPTLGGKLSETPGLREGDRQEAKMRHLGGGGLFPPWPPILASRGAAPSLTSGPGLDLGGTGGGRSRRNREAGCPEPAVSFSEERPQRNPCSEETRAGTRQGGFSAPLSRGAGLGTVPGRGQRLSIFVRSKARPGGGRCWGQAGSGGSWAARALEFEGGVSLWTVHMNLVGRAPYPHTCQGGTHCPSQAFAKASEAHLGSGQKPGHLQPLGRWALTPSAREVTPTLHTGPHSLPATAQPNLLTLLRSCLRSFLRCPRWPPCSPWGRGDGHYHVCGGGCESSAFRPVLLIPVTYDKDVHLPLTDGEADPRGDFSTPPGAQGCKEGVGLESGVPQSPPWLRLPSAPLHTVRGALSISSALSPVCRP